MSIHCYGTSENASNEDVPEVDNESDISIVTNLKLPPFWISDPELWFTQVEATFGIAEILNDDEKYKYVIDNKDPVILPYILDIIKNPPATGKYDTIKNRVLSIFLDSEKKALFDTLKCMKLGVQKPSKFLKQIKNKTLSRFGDDTLRSIFLGHMSAEVRDILIGCNEQDLNKLSDIADKILKLSNPKQEYIPPVGVSSAAVNVELHQKINKLNYVPQSKSHGNLQTKELEYDGISNYENNITRKFVDLQVIASIMEDHCYHRKLPDISINENGINIFIVSDSSDEENLNIKTTCPTDGNRRLHMNHKFKSQLCLTYSKHDEAQLKHTKKLPKTYIKRTMKGSSNTTTDSSSESEETDKHVVKERLRRSQLKFAFEFLQLQVPAIENLNKISMIDILRQSAMYIRTLQDNYERNQKKIAQLKLTQFKLKKRIQQLEKEMKLLR